MGTIIFGGFCVIIILSVLFFFYLRRGKTRDKNLKKENLSKSQPQNKQDVYE